MASRRLNSWRSGSPLSPVRLAYVATNSTERLSFVSLQTSSQLARIVRLAARPSLFLDMPYGVVIEIHLSRDLTEGETIQVALAQAGATTYYPPQPIDDSR